MNQVNKIHRWLNTALTALVLCGLVVGGKFAYAKYSSITIEETYASEMTQITKDEGFRECTYKDTKGLGTIGFGHLILTNEEITCITLPEAMLLLQKDYTIALTAVERNFPWAEGEVKLVLTNMSYQLGITKLLKFKKTLKHLKAKDYTNASIEMTKSRWYKETPKRALRQAIRILALEEK